MPARRGRFARLTPAHGWRSFVTELAIVVLGVLIALGAQQAVDGWNTRADVADFRVALRTELADNLASYRARLNQGGCVVRKLDQLDAWQREWRDGNGPPLSGAIGRPLAYSISFSVWRTGTGGIANRMPLRERLFFADTYATLENYDGLRDREADVWYALLAFDGATRLSPAEVNTLRGLILAARTTDRSIRYNWAGFVRGAAEQGVVAQAELPPPNTNGLCEPLRFSAASAR